MHCPGFFGRIERRHLYVAAGIFSTLCCVGLVFGWANLVIALRDEGYYAELCPGNQTVVRVLHCWFSDSVFSAMRPLLGLI